MAPGIAAVKNSFMGGVLEKSAVESIRCTIVSFLPFGHGSPEGEKAGKKRPAIANTITERTRHLIRLIQGDEASPLAYCDTQPSDEILLFFAPAQRGRVQGTGPIVAEIKEKSSAPRGAKSGVLGCGVL